MVDGADFLDVGGVKAGPGDEVSEAEELERVVPAIEALARAVRRARSRSTPGEHRCAKAAYGVGAVVGNDISGFADPDYLSVAAAAGRVRRRHPHPARARVCPIRTPCTTSLSSKRSCRSAPSARRGAEAAGIPRERVMVDAGLDLGKTEPQSLELLRASRPLVALGYPVFLSASNKRFLGVLLGSRWGSAARRRSPPTRSASRSAVASCGPTTCRGRAAPPTCSPRCSRRAAREPCRHLLRGDDQVLLADAVELLVHELVGDEDRALVVDEVDRATTTTVARIVDAARTPPFLTEPSSRRRSPHRAIHTTGRRRSACRLPRRSADTTELVLGGAAARCTEALARRGEEAEGRDHRHRPGSRRDVSGSRSSSTTAAVKLDAVGRDLVADRLGEDLGRLPALLDGLEATYGPGARTRRGRGRAVPRRGGRSAAVGAHRRDRPRRHRRRARSAAAG